MHSGIIIIRLVLNLNCPPLAYRSNIFDYYAYISHIRKVERTCPSTPLHGK